MSNVITIYQQVKMSSREIARLTGKRHDHVLVDCRKMFESLNIQSPEFSGDYKDTNGRTYQEYLLDQDLTMTLVMGYSIPLRHKVATRWRELEEKATRPVCILPNFEDPPVAAMAWAEQFREKTRLALVNKEQEAELHELKNLFKEGITTTQFCKMLNGINTQQINHCLADRNWLYNESKSHTRWRATSYARDRYLTEHQHKISIHSGDDFIKYQPVLLRKGAIRLFDLYRKNKLPMKTHWDGHFTHEKELGIAS
ncbi:Rha family transcriptional regulator [Candidatus Fukatsuia endosymbiont of Tuberolachnus salignus]|uniref:Rha family transcriptional regulator n=1 Tax=Candidatus Fukatsuia endosymbiont of Tuberolachnus salignus TaxID=3077957 RepID=UPI00313D4D9A